MVNKTILVTGVGGDIGQSVLKCLKDTAYKLKIIGCDMDPYAAGKMGGKKFFKSPSGRRSEAYLKFLNEVIDTENIQYILPTTEVEIEFYDAHREYLRNKQVTLFINSSEAIRTFLDKYNTIRFLKKNGLPYPQTYLLESYKNELPFPLLIKMRKGWGGKGLLRIEDKYELAFYKKRVKGAIVQEIVGSSDQEYTVGVFSDGKAVHSIAFRRCLGYGSLTKVAQLVHDDTINYLVERIARASSLEGALNVQLRRVGDCYIPFEINPRFSSTVYFRHYFGFQDVKWWIDLKEGRKIEYMPKYNEGVAVRTLGETFFDLVPVLGGASKM